MTEATITLSGEQMFTIRQSALNIALNARHSDDPAAKILVDASAYLNFLLNGIPSDTVPGYITAPKPNTPEVLAGAGAPTNQETAPATPKATRGKAKLAAVDTSASAAATPSTALVQAANPVQTATVASGSAITGSSTATSLIPAPATLQEAANSLKALVQDDSRGGRKAAVDLLAAYGVTQLNQIPAPKLAEFKAALDNAGKQAVPASNGSDLI